MKIISLSILNLLMIFLSILPQMNITHPNIQFFLVKIVPELLRYR